MAQTSARTRRLTVVAQDPGVRSEDGRILCVPIQLPAEALDRGPWGHRVQVIDFDATTNKLLAPLGDSGYAADRAGNVTDPFDAASNRTILSDPQFHAQNVYGIVSQTLARFERALGRRVNWGFAGHQLRVAPHAFADANAFYAPEEQALFFGYFVGETGQTSSPVSHDVIAHETTHAPHDGILPASPIHPPRSAAFHEGFADCVALLSVFSQREVSSRRSNRAREAIADQARVRPSDRKSRADARRCRIRVLGWPNRWAEMAQIRGSAPSPLGPVDGIENDSRPEEHHEPHRRGEVLVAAVMQTSWKCGRHTDSCAGWAFQPQRVAEEGCAAADYLLTMLIRIAGLHPAGAPGLPRLSERGADGRHRGAGGGRPVWLSGGPAGTVQGVRHRTRVARIATAGRSLEPQHGRRLLVRPQPFRGAAARSRRGVCLRLGEP